jgi:hypothetical protein
MTLWSLIFCDSSFMTLWLGLNTAEGDVTARSSADDEDLGELMFSVVPAVGDTAPIWFSFVLRDARGNGVARHSVHVSETVALA